jgi:hypothetical protein
MSQLHICNTFFEKELETGAKKSLAEWMRAHPIVMQLQFLPLLYAGPNDRILVSDLPENPDPRLCLIDDPPHLPIEHWGPSLAIAEWAKSHNLNYEKVDWSTVKKVNSKVFSFTESSKLPGAQLLNSQDEIADWIQNTPDPKVLKTPFGTAGGGHILNPNVKRLYICPTIGEPWVERIMDFSTQWKNGKLIGVTVFENETNGTYKGTFAGEVEQWAIEEHLSSATPLIQKLMDHGYTDHVGIDAFIYLWKGKKKLHPIVEINGRKTMSWVALQMETKRLYYTRGSDGLLPKKLRNIEFKRNITSC